MIAFDYELENADPADLCRNDITAIREIQNFEFYSPI